MLSFFDQIRTDSLFSFPGLWPHPDRRGVLKMTNRQQLITAAAATILLSIGGPAAASDDADIAFESEVNSCIAEINVHVNYTDATRVRHTVIKVKNTFIGYVFTIDTDVFANSDSETIREYASYCVAKGQNKPVKFRIDETSA